MAPKAPMYFERGDTITTLKLTKTSKKYFLSKDILLPPFKNLQT